MEEARLNGNGDLWISDGASHVDILRVEPENVLSLDVAWPYAVVSYVDRPALLIDAVTGARFEVPIADGLATISFNTGTAAGPSTTTTDTTAPDSTAPVVTPEPIEVSGTVVTAGLDGVWRVVDGVETQLTAEPMSMALELPDGSVIMQRKSGWSGDGSTQSDTTLLVWRNGQVDELFPGEVLGGWVRLHDVAMVNGEMKVLYAVEWQPSPEVSPSQPAWTLLARSLATSETTWISSDASSWERGYSRMHLAETGLILGELYQEARRQLISYSIGDPLPVSPVALGLEEFYSDCSDCPRLYTVRRDGTVVAWLDGTMLRVATPDLTAVEQFDLGDAALRATELELGIGFAVLSFGAPSNVRSPQVIDFNIGADSAAELRGAAATIVTLPTPPWQVNEELTADLVGQDYDTVEAVFDAVEARIEAVQYAAVEPVEPIVFTRSRLADGTLQIAAPNFDDSVPQTWYRVVPGVAGYGQIWVIGRIESVNVCRDGTYSTPSHLCV